MCQFISLKIGFLQSNHLDLECKGLLIHLMSKASHKDFKLKSGKKVLRSQFVTSLSKLSKEADITIRRVRTLISKLEKLEEIKIESSKEGTTITVLKYDEYIATEKPNTTHIEVKESANVSITEEVKFSVKDELDEFKQMFKDELSNVDEDKDLKNRFYKASVLKMSNGQYRFQHREFKESPLRTVLFRYIQRGYKFA